MAITTDNILVGQGDLSIDSVDLGATEGGFVLNQEQEWFDAMVDQSVGVQKKKLVRRRLFGKANIAEAALANFAIGYGLPASGISGQTLTFGGTDRGTVTGSFIVSKGNPAGFDRTLTFAKIVSLGNSESPFKRDGITFVPVEFEILPSADGADTFFTIHDATA